MAVRIEDAGFEIRDMIAWVYGSGFPKSLDVSKALDKAAGAEREVVGIKRGTRGADGTGHENAMPGKATGVKQVSCDVPLTATASARQWSGWGTALKPALEPITLARKPLIGTVAENVLAHGTGALNVDGCRVEFAGEPSGVWGAKQNTQCGSGGTMGAGWSGRPSNKNDKGRWPANLIHDGSEEVLAGFPSSSGGAWPADGAEFGYSGGTRKQRGERTELGDSGSAARFFFKASLGDEEAASRFMYCAKASRRERNAGVLDPGNRRKRNDTTGGKYAEAPNPAGSNHHPTVKPIALMRYLCRLITPPGGVVLDPFMGSGTTGIAAKLEGFDFIGIEREADYIAIAEARINHWEPEADLFGT
jgi:site-specific DNA-methyltransferase (adenine-specific)